MRPTFERKINEFEAYELSDVITMMQSVKWTYADSGPVTRQSALKCIRENFETLEHSMEEGLPYPLYIDCGGFRVYPSGRIEFVGGEVSGDGDL